MYICTWQSMGATSCHVITCHVIIRRINPSTSYVIRRHPVHVNNECMRTYAQKCISVINTIIIIIVTPRLTRMNKASRHGVTSRRHGVTSRRHVMSRIQPIGIKEKADVFVKSIGINEKALVCI